MSNIQKKSKQEFLKSSPSVLDQIVKDIGEEKDTNVLCGLVQKFQRRQSEKLAKLWKKSEKIIGQKQQDFFWVNNGFEKIDSHNQDFAMVKLYLYRFNYAVMKDDVKSSPDYKHIINLCFNNLEKKKNFQVLNALKYLIAFGQTLNTYQYTHIRNTIREHPFILELMVKRLEEIQKIPKGDVVKLIIAFVDLTVKISQLPLGTNWTWLNKVILIDVVKLCESLANQPAMKEEYNKLVVLLNSMCLSFLLVNQERDLKMCLKMGRIATNITMKYPTWTIPDQYIEPWNKSSGSSVLKCFQVSYIQFIQIVGKINSCITNEVNEEIFEDELLNTYRSAIRKMNENDPEGSLLIHYELVSLCHRTGNKVFLNVVYTNIAYCFFVLRQTQTAYLYLELVCLLGQTLSTVASPIVAHKVMAKIAGCEFDYKRSIFHLRKALELCSVSKYVERELRHEEDEIRTCLGEALAKYKMTQGRLSLDDPIDINFKCTCFLYQRD